MYDDDYDRAEQTITYEEALTSATPWKLHFKLEPLVQVFDVRIETTPPGATVRINGKTHGKSPVVVPVRFTRSASRSSWGVVDVSVANVRCSVAIEVGPLARCLKLVGPGEHYTTQSYCYALH